jgi:uncharacterized protein
MDLRAASTVIAWQPWSAAAFARARAERKAVLLSIGASWCHWCHEMDRTSYADPGIAALINERFVAVRVDADERPDISERYNLGGWPTTAFLTPDGEILAGGTFVPLDQMGSVLSRVSEEFAGLTAPAKAAASPPEPSRRWKAGTTDPVAAGLKAGTTDPVAAGLKAGTTNSGVAGLTAGTTDSGLTDAVFASFDPMHGGFGIEPKFPLSAPVQLALDLWQTTQDTTYHDIAMGTLDAMGWGGLYDDVDGGFFRYATTRDWQLPHFEKLLETNAALLRVYLNAGEILDAPRFTGRAADTLRYIQNTLADPLDGGWRTSQAAEPSYYAAGSTEERRLLQAPAVCDRLYADATAAMVSAAFHAARVFGDEGLREFAVKSLERVLLPCYKPGRGVAHYSDGEPRVRGLLADQVAMSVACLDAFDATGNIVYEMMAEELAHYMIRDMWDEAGGGFFDRRGEAPDQEIGRLRQALKPFVVNCEAARMLRRLAASSGDNDFAICAERTLAAMAPCALEQGPLAAHYLLARRA